MDLKVPLFQFIGELDPFFRKIHRNAPSVLLIDHALDESPFFQGSEYPGQTAPAEIDALNERFHRQ